MPKLDARVHAAAALLDGPDLVPALDRVLADFGCATGTVHVLQESLLVLRAARGVPPSLIPRIARIPLGKGMAGACALRREPVQVCDLMAEAGSPSGAGSAIRPGARATGAGGSIAVPMLDGDELCGALGIARAEAYDFAKNEVDALLGIAARFGAHVKALARASASLEASRGAAV